MAQEDKSGQQKIQHDLVARREELDSMYEQSRNLYGDEFSVYLKMSTRPGEANLKDEFDSLKTKSFIADVI